MAFPQFRRRPFSRVLLPALAASLLFGVFAGCSKTTIVTLPPKVDLKTHQLIGVIEFTANGEEGLKQAITQKFMQRIQAGQQVSLLELGNREQVLRAVNHTDLHLEAIRAIGQKYGVDAVFFGRLEISDVKPNLQVSPNLTSVSAQAYVNGSLNARLWQTATGATLWTNSANGRWSVEKYGQMINALGNAVSADFMPRYEKRKVAK